MPWDGTERRGAESNQYLTLQDQLNRQDDILFDLRDTIKEHLIESRDIGPALKELVTLWKASKLLGAIFAASAAALASMWSLFVWTKDHLK